VKVTHFEEPFVRKIGRVSTTTPNTVYTAGEEQAMEIDLKLSAAMAFVVGRKFGLSVLQASEALISQGIHVKARIVLSISLHHELFVSKQ
jgi:hypothetical protein